MGEVWYAVLGIILVLLVMDVSPKAGALLLIAIVILMLTRLQQRSA